MIDPMPYRLGCPVWACEAWPGTLYSTKNRRRWLSEYSTVFGTVEGNTTFYALPKAEVVARWADESADGFRFALKTPRSITHEHQLVGAQRETAEWIERLRTLQAADRLGPTLLQLPPFFSDGQFDDLARFVEAWPKDLPLAVEPRYEAYFDGGPVENEFDALLRERGVDRALFDSRALFNSPPEDESEKASRGRKPNPPHRQTVTGRGPFLRFIGRNRLSLIDPWIGAWGEVIAGWIEAGLNPYIFCHAPNDAFAPAFARRLHAALQKRLPQLPDMQAWPGQSAPKQQSLF